MALRRVLLTGGSRGIGRAIKEVLEKTGEYHVIAPTSKELDLNEPAMIDSFMNGNKEIDVLINNAGINILNHIEDINIVSVDSMLNINLTAPIKLIQNVVPHMKNERFGRIVNISSIWGIRSKEYRTLYSATKFGINGITKALARELGEYNILVNSICPGYVNTELTQNNIPLDEQDKIKKDIPLKRFAEPFEIANLVEFLISEKNTYLTGQAIIIDGGFTA